MDRGVKKMEFHGQVIEIIQAFKFIKGNYTAKQLESASLAIDVTADEVAFISVGLEAYYKSVIQNVDIIQEGSVQVDFSMIEEIIAHDKTKAFQIESRNDQLHALIEDSEEIIGEGMEIDIHLESLNEVARLEQVEFVSLLKELLANTMKTARTFTDTLLLRLRKEQLNGRAISMQGIVVNSLAVETENKGLMDMYLTKPQAQTFNKALQLMPKKEIVALLESDGQLGVTANGLTCVLLVPQTVVGMPDITQLMRRCGALHVDEAIRVSVNDWKKILTTLQKETNEEEREHLKHGLTASGTFTDQVDEAKVWINVKSVLKNLRASQAKELDLYFMEKQAIVLRYCTDTRSHYSVLMTGKE